MQKLFRTSQGTLKQKKKKTFTNIEIRTQLRIKESTLRNYHKQLQLLGYIKRNTNKKTRSYTFELVISKDYETLQKDIQTALDKALQNIKKPKSNSK